ncbi:MAG: hypothetical protein JW850_20295 [Thermoflexales bacterium]|nr:hypothetical protein [Thermoflexales bacterium]
MTAGELYAELTKRGVTLALDGDGRLLLNPAAAVTPDLRVWLGRHKAELCAAVALDLCQAAWDAGDLDQAQAWAGHYAAWADGVTLILPGDTPAGLPAGRWRRLDDGKLWARFSIYELATSLAILGSNSPAVTEAIAAGG